jgi:tetratricopeptide (TPR) repeat protein
MFKKNIIIKANLIILVTVFSAYAQAGTVSNGQNIIKDEMWGIEFKLDGYNEWTDHPLRSQLNFIFAGKLNSQSCQILVSMFAKPASNDATPQWCRKTYLRDPKALEDSAYEIFKQRSKVVLVESKDAPLTYTLLDQRFEGPKPFVDNALHGFWARGDSCLELHLSSVNCSNFKELAMPILESVRITPDNGATPETVAIARLSSKMGDRPGDWQIHMIVGDKYLYAKQPMPDRARHFYESALKRGGSSIDEGGRWQLQEGIGLAWLAENNGKNALSYFIKALDAVDKGNLGTGRRSETFYNMACAYSLIGETKKACKSLNDSLSIQDTADKEKTIKQMQDDEQFKSIHNAECYLSLLKGFEGK